MALTMTLAVMFIATIILARSAPAFSRALLSQPKAGSRMWEPIATLDIVARGSAHTLESKDR